MQFFTNSFDIIIRMLPKILAARPLPTITFNPGPLNRLPGDLIYFSLGFLDTAGLLNVMAAHKSTRQALIQTGFPYIEGLWANAIKSIDHVPPAHASYDDLQTIVQTLDWNRLRSMLAFSMIHDGLTLLNLLRTGQIVSGDFMHWDRLQNITGSYRDSGTYKAALEWFSEPVTQVGARRISRSVLLHEFAIGPAPRRMCKMFSFEVYSSWVEMPDLKRQIPFEEPIVQSLLSGISDWRQREVLKLIYDIFDSFPVMPRSYRAIASTLGGLQINEARDPEPLSLELQVGAIARYSAYEELKGIFQNYTDNLLRIVEACVPPPAAGRPDCFHNAMVILLNIFSRPEDLEKVAARPALLNQLAQYTARPSGSCSAMRALVHLSQNDVIDRFIATNREFLSATEEVLMLCIAINSRLDYAPIFYSPHFSLESKKVLMLMILRIAADGNQENLYRALEKKPDLKQLMICELDRVGHFLQNTRLPDHIRANLEILAKLGGKIENKVLQILARDAVRSEAKQPHIRKAPDGKEEAEDQNPARRQKTG